MSFSALIHPAASIEIKLTNSFAMIVMGWTSRTTPSGHRAGKATGESTGGSALGFPCMNRHRPGGVSTEPLIGTSGSSARTRLTFRIAQLFPLPAGPTYMTYTFGNIAVSSKGNQTRLETAADSATYAPHTWNISGASFPVA